MDDRQSYAIAALVVTVWSEWANDENEYSHRNFTVDEFADTLRELSVAEYVTDGDVARFIDYAVSNDIGTLVQTPYARPRVKFDPRTIYNHAQKLGPKDPIKLAFDLGLRWVIESLQNIGIKPLPTERLLRETTISSETVDGIESSDSDDSWEPLPIDKRRDDYEAMISSLGDAIEAVRGDNGYSATYPAERNSVLETLQTGFKWLHEKTEVPRKLLTSLVIDPLRRCIERFKEAVPGALAKAAVDAVIKFFFGP